MSLTVDASVFVAASRTEEIHYQASRHFLQQMQAQQCDLYCPTLLLPECAAAIARPTANAQLAEELVLLIQGLPRLHLVALDRAMAQRASQVARDHRLRGSDSVYVSVADVFDSKLIAWDAELLERGAGLVTTMTPLEWMAETVA